MNAMKPKLKIALVAHDHRKADMVDWVKYNALYLARHELVCTGTTGRLIKEALAGAGIAAHVECMNSGPMGGDAEIARHGRTQRNRFCHISYRRPESSAPRGRYTDAFASMPAAQCADRLQPHQRRSHYFQPAMGRPHLQAHRTKLYTLRPQMTAAGPAPQSVL